MAAIFGVIGACSIDDLLRLEKDHVADDGEEFVVTIPKKYENETDKSFTVSKPYYATVKKYIQARVSKDRKDKTNRFFLYYKNGKCTNQPIGIHGLSKIPRNIALYLNLPEPEKYLGTSLKKTTATLVGNHVADLLRRKKPEDHPSAKVNVKEEDVIYMEETDTDDDNKSRLCTFLCYSDLSLYFIIITCCIISVFKIKNQIVMLMQDQKRIVVMKDYNRITTKMKAYLRINVEE